MLVMLESLKSHSLSTKLLSDVSSFLRNHQEEPNLFNSIQMALALSQQEAQHQVIHDIELTLTFKCEEYS